MTGDLISRGEDAEIHTETHRKGHVGRGKYGSGAAASQGILNSAESQQTPGRRRGFSLAPS